MAANISQLSSTIASSVEDIVEVLASNNLPDPTWDGDIPPFIQQDSHYANTRADALKACRQLIAILQDPFEVIANRTPPEMVFIQAICQFDIAKNFPADQSTVTYEELSRACIMPEPQLRRIVRGAMATNVFREEKGLIAHTPTSRVLATNPLIRRWIEMTSSEINPATTRVVDAMVKWSLSEEPNQTGYSIANNTDDTAFVHMSKFPGRAERFADAMSLFSQGPRMSPQHILTGFPWETLGEATIVDVGGSHGQVTIPIVQKFPNIRCIVQDLPDTVRTAPKFPDLGSRVLFMVHDFFEEQPVQGAAVYFLRWVLHDWPDKYAIKILQALIPALKAGSRVIIMEAVVPEPHEIPSSEQKQARLFDMAMLALQNGKEREAQDWKSLIERTDSRFKIIEIRTLKESDLGIIELVWEP
jgi:hypothetical protein